MREQSGIFWKKYKCSFCNFKTEKFEDLIYHIDSHDKNSIDTFLEKQVSKVKVIWEKYKCPFCDFTTEKRGDLMKHMDDLPVHRAYLFNRLNNNQCPYCDFKAEKLADVGNHILIKHC